MITQEPIAELELRVDSTANCEPQHFMFYTRVDFLNVESGEEVHQTLDQYVDDLAGCEVSEQPGSHLHLVVGAGGRALERM